MPCDVQTLACNYGCMALEGTFDTCKTTRDKKEILGMSNCKKKVSKDLKQEFKPITFKQPRV